MNKVNLLILLWEKLLKNKQKLLKIKEKNKIKAIKDNKEQSVNINSGDYKDKLLLSKEREIFKDICNKRLDKREELNNKIDYNNLKYVVLNSGYENAFNKLDDPLVFLDNIEKIKYRQKKQRINNKSS